MIYWKYDIEKDECYISFKTKIKSYIIAYCCYGNGFYITFYNRFSDASTLTKNQLLNASRYIINLL